MSASAAATEPLASLATRFGLATADLAAARPAPELLRLVPRDFAVRYQLVPLNRTADTLHVAVADPADTEGTDALGHLTGLGLELQLAEPAALARAIDRIYGKTAGLTEVADQPRLETDAFVPGIESTTASDDAPIIRLVEDLMAEAVRRRASDIHLEPLAQQLRVRYRIDGILQEAESAPKHLQPAIVSRLKIMADLSIAEKRLPQDGRMRFAAAGRRLDLRVSSIPTVHGESLVLRVLDQESLKPGLAELGLAANDRARLDRLVGLPDGIILVTGPTGSGKTTTLYACLHHLNQADRKIITVEDPVEYQLNGINQVPVRPEVGMTFASALRAMLRQAPNVVMVGEVRDLETAEIAINASLTGHLVFSTLHTNDAAGAVTRLMDLGAKPYLLASALRGIVAQRLVRRVCSACSRPHHPTATELALLGLEASAGHVFRHGAGCPECRGTGYRGRTGLFEVVAVDEALRNLIHAGASGARLRAAARAAGCRSLRTDAVIKLSAGLTTVEEVVSITVGDVE